MEIREKMKEKNTKQRLIILLILGVVSIVILYVFSLTQGIYDISFSDAINGLINIITTGQPVSIEEKVIYYLRMPRSIAVLCVGAGLATAGAIMQALIRNPLVDPYITGVSSGASFFVILVTLGGVSVGVSAGLIIPVAAIVGAILAFSLTMIIAESAGGRSMNYVLAGVIISAGLTAASTLIIYFNAKDYANIMGWMFGSFMNITWSNTIIIFIGTVIPISISLLFARRLNMMLLGEEQARYLGMNAKTLKRVMMILTAVLTGFCVAYCGVIGFIGLVIPHVCRMIVGGDHRLLMPASIVLGALVLLIADIFCKTIAEPSELPIGAIVAVIGVPFFLFLMIKEGKKYAM